MPMRTMRLQCHWMRHRSLSSLGFDLLAPYTERLHHLALLNSSPSKESWHAALLINPVASSTTSCSASSATHEERQSMTARALA